MTDYINSLPPEYILRRERNSIMKEMMVDSASTDKDYSNFEYLMRVSREFRSEVDKLRGILYETRITTGRVSAPNANYNAPLTANQSPSTFLIAFLLKTLLERNDRIDFLHKQVAANTKRLAELNERALQYH